jgi:hypothetical protein
MLRRARWQEKRTASERQKERDEAAKFVGFAFYMVHPYAV